MKVVFALAIVVFSFTFATAQNEQAPVVEKQFDYKNWKYENVRGGDDIDLRSFQKTKSL